MKHQAVATIPYNKSVDVASMPDRVRRPAPVSSTRAGRCLGLSEWFTDGQPSCKIGEGEPDFRVIDPGKLLKAVKQHLKCWVCGEGPCSASTNVS